MTGYKLCPLLALVSLAGSACDDAPATAPPAAPGPFAEIDSPAGPGSETPRLRASPGGLILSWLEPADPGSEDEYALRFSRFADGTWSSPRTVISRGDLFVNWADFPSVIDLGEGHMAAHWLQYNGPGTYAYQVRLAFSDDGGTTWSAGIVPHEAETQTEHGFVSLVPGDGGVEVVWLDGRDYAADGDEGEMSLRHATVAPDGSVGTEAVLDPRTCDCCQTSVAPIPGGLVAAYRGRSAEEIRDIYVVRRLDGAWEDPRPVHADGWHIPACPVNGPEIVAAGPDLSVTWFTAAVDSGRVYLARSSDAGRSFEPPIRIDDGRPIGRVGALALPGGRTLVTWLEAGGDGEGAAVMARVVDRRGRTSAPTAVGTSSVARASGFPVVALSGDRIVVAWTDPDEDRVRVAEGAVVH